ncbi:MAG: LLM class flavin-dependent oxidoreductase [Rhodospirillaceae bacterium]|nr:LLM class flavin-dependent oxidoreductase [Rhodospirillaceae bacterium]
MAIGIGLGMAEFPFSSAKAFWRWVDQCETGGIDSLWQTDRLVSKVPFLEAMSTMAALAGATQRLKFGMNVASAGLRDPLLLAKQCATVDFLSSGRILPAFGVGSPLAPDWSATGRSSQGSGKIADEALDLIAALWREEKVSYDGQYFQYKEATISPRPVNKNIPLWIGGSSKAAIRRTARIGTGWQAGAETPAQVAPVIAAIKAATAEAGRSIDDDHYGTGFYFRFGGWEDGPLPFLVKNIQKRTGRDPKYAFAVGSADDICARIEEYIAAGVSKFVLRPTGGSDQELLDQTQRLIEDVIPVFAGR